LDNPSSSPCSSTICIADFPLMNLQLHKSALHTASFSLYTARCSSSLY
jgi:hypothetical protein